MGLLYLTFLSIIFIYQTIRRQITEDFYLHSCCRKNLTFREAFLFRRSAFLLLYTCWCYINLNCKVLLSVPQVRVPQTDKHCYSVLESVFLEHHQTSDSVLLCVFCTEPECSRYSDYATDWTVRVLNPGRVKGFFSFPKRPDRLWGPSSLSRSPRTSEVKN
jgi:hypothetical protein